MKTIATSSDYLFKLTEMIHANRTFLLHLVLVLTNKGCELVSCLNFNKKKVRKNSSLDCKRKNSDAYRPFICGLHSGIDLL